MTAPSAISATSRRAVLRWAWRLFRREWRQQTLVFALIVLAVAASVAGAAFMTNAVSPSQAGEFGNATGLSHVDNQNPPAAQDLIAQAKDRFGAVEIVGHRSVAAAGLAQPVDVRLQDPHGQFGASTLSVRSGRFPTAANEVALTSHLAKVLSTRVGASVTLDGVRRTVVGIVRNPWQLNDQFALLAPGTEPAQTFTLLFDNPNGRGGSITARADGPLTPLLVQTRDTNKAAVAAVVLAATAVGLLLVGLIAAAGFVVVAQRRQRQLGLLSAIGATQRHIGLVMVANGALVGAAASVVGVGIGIVGWILAAPAAEVVANHRLDRFALPWALIFESTLLAIAMATAAAWWPTRAVAKLSVMAALSGRPARPAAVHRSLMVALVFLGGGAALIVGAIPNGSQVRAPFLLGGLAAVVLGTVFATPSAIRALSPVARRLPFTLRLAVRDLVRYHARAAAALAAITLVLGITAALVGLANANVDHANQGNLSAHDLVVRAVPPKAVAGDGPIPTNSASRDTDAARVAHALGTSSTIVALDVAVPATPGPEGAVPIGVAHELNVHSFQGRGVAFVESPALLAYLGIDPSTIRPTTELITAQTDSVTLLDVSKRAPSTTHVQYITGPAYTSAPISVITPFGMTKNNWHAVRAEWIVSAPHALTTSQIAAARREAATGGLTIEARDSQGGIAAIRTDATAIGALIALVIAAMTVGLIRSESTRDLRTLTATGASARARRALTASTTGVLAALGAVVGTVGAYVALGAAYHHDLGRLTPIPFAPLLLLVLGLPVVAMGAGWLLGGREPRTFSHQMAD